MIQAPQSRVLQKQFPLAVDRNHPINHGLVRWWPFIEHGGDTVKDITSRYSASLVNSPAWSRNMVDLVPASSQYIDLNMFLRDHAPNAVTLAVWCNLDDVSGSKTLFTDWDASALHRTVLIRLDGTGIDFFTCTTGGSINSIEADDLTLTTGVDHLVVLTWDGALMRGYRDGLQSATTQAATGTLGQGAGGSDNSLSLGFASTSGAYADGRIGHARIWDRALPPGEVARLYADPWIGLLRPRFVTNTGGTIGDMEATLDMALAVGGTLLGSGALEGTAGIALDLSGTLLGSGAMEGDLSIALDVSGTLLGAGALEGDLSLALAVGGTLLGAGAMAATLPLALAVSGTLLGSGALVASPGITITVEGTLNSASMVGEITLSLGVSGRLRGCRSLVNCPDSDESYSISSGTAASKSCTDPLTNCGNDFNYSLN